MKPLFYMLLLLCPYASSSQPLPKGLQPGDQIPAFTASNVLNHTTTKLNSTQFKNKLLILDFIRTTCSGCISKLAYYQQLQTQFKNQLTILLVTQEKTAVVKAYMKRPNAKPLLFPILTADEELSNLFPHESLSHLVWIDGSGKVKAITEGDWLTEKNIQEALQPGDLAWPVKRDLPYFDYSASMITLGEQTAAFTTKPMQYAALLPYLPDVTSRFTLSIDSAAGSIRWQAFNQSIVEMYTRLCRRFNFPLSQVILQVANKTAYEYLPSFGPRRSWQEQYARSFEILLAFNGDTTGFRQKIHAQLDALLNLHTRFQKQQLQCLQITPAPNSPTRNQITHNTPTPNPITRNIPTHNPITNQQPTETLTLWWIAHHLNQQFSEQPILLAHDSLNNITVNITEKEVYNKSILQQRLLEAGFEMLPQTREMETLIITEN